MESRLITPAFAQGGFAGGTDVLLQLVPFVLIFIIMWFLIIRPQQRRAKEHQEMLKNVRRGDTVVTSGGIVGRGVEVAGGVGVKVARTMIAYVRTKGEPVKA